MPYKGACLVTYNIFEQAVVEDDWRYENGW